MTQRHKTIWLQPWCDGCEKNFYGIEGRMWCQDDVWGKCDECEEKSVKYVIDELTPDMREGE